MRFMQSSHCRQSLTFFRRASAALLLLILLILCSAGHAESITLRVWCMGGEAEKLPLLARRFENENPGVKVRIQALSWGGSYEKLVTAFLGGAPPDVCQMGTTMMKDFYAMGALENLQPLFGADGLSADDFFSESLKTCFYDGSYYGVPWYVDTRVVYYRREYLDRFGWKEFPKTWDDFVKFGKQVTAAKLAAGDTIGYFCSLQGFTFEMFYWQAGGNFVPLQADFPAFDEEKMAVAVDFERSMHREGFIGKPHDSGIDYISEFDQGFYEVAVSGPWMAADLKKNQHRLKSSWGMAVMPANKTATSFIGGSNLVQFKESRHKEIGRKFILFLSRPEIQAEWYEISSDIPASRHAMQTPQLIDDPVMQVFRAQLEDTRLPPSEKEWSIFWDRFHRRYSAFMESGDDAETFVKEMNAVMAEVVRERDMAGRPRTGMLYWVALTFFPLLLVSIYVLRGLYGQKTLPALNSTPLRRVACFLLPALAVMLVFRLLPLCVAFAASFTDLGAANITDPANSLFTGTGNYLRLYQDEVFWKSVRNTLIYLLIGVPLNMLIALTLALAINRLRGWRRTLLASGLFLPSVITMVASAVTWRWLYCQQSPINIAINALGFGPYNWLGDPDLALPSLIIFSVWRSYGLSMLIIMAGLELINRELYESVRIDGGSRWHEFCHVTLPGLRGTLFAVAVGATVANIQFFIEPYVLTGGGPKDATMSLLLFSYNRAFGSFQLGYASSVITVLFAFFFIFNIWQRHFRRKLS
ncbi:MAG TPA: hypothetical protein DCG57_21105 [Candidatus Riflebacteria bacterium]|nr:hypothetical protein [Candidatus Riflebacteria bacterium]